ncbi:hypothetical protein [Corallococcus macrosporus]|uniref:Uncharacterized protein n=1 Tax=Myxococcus fulvus (strain ATCC BAA-855 / HW-1) TaxID=483219 RepID=F8CHG1_MYXFH|nr:hypothetical protein [Corallococcus macrosporus]AEI66279.1 hypothetical protein LILAB_21895 [Corallococcus macrosporus]
MATENLIYWRHADERGLKPVRTLDLRVEPDRDGRAFLIRELVEYDSGQRGWRFRTGEGPMGNSFIHKFKKFKTAAKAEAEVASVRFDMAVREADAVLRDEFGIDHLRRDNLRRLWGERTTLEPGKLPTAEELVALFREQHATLAAALDAIRAQGGEQQPRDYELMWGFKEGRRSVGELVAWWRERLEMQEARRVSSELRERKAKERSERRAREDAFLSAKAADKAAALVPPERDALLLVGRASESVLKRIAVALCEKPYLRHVLMFESGYPRLYVSEDGLVWKEWGRNETYESKRRIAARAVIADAFGMDPKDHWGRVRGALLKMLKPSNLDMLHRKDVQDALEKARAAGRTLVVIRQLAFLWDEEAGEWHLREVERRDSATAPGCTLWAEGPIESTNYGRIIVLPYVKEDGTQVVGHTRNAPHEGLAEPRAETKVIRFAVYDELGRDDTWDHYGNEFVSDDDDEGDV